MKLKHYLFYAVLCLLILTITLATREMPVNPDTPAFIMKACGIENTIGLPIPNLFFQSLPCNTNLFLILPIIILFITLIILAKTGELINSEHGWLAGLLAFSNLYFLPTLLGFEEQHLAIPLVYACFYFVIKHLVQNKKEITWKSKELIISLALLLISGLFWRGSFFYLFLIGLLLIPLGLICIPLLAYYFEFFKNYFLQTLNPLLLELTGKTVEVVTENMMFFGIFENFALLAGFFTQNKKLRIPLIFTGLLAFFSAKYSIYLLPFLIAGCIEYLSKKELKVFFLIFAVGMFSYSLVMIPQFYPNNIQVQAVRETVELADGNLIMNDWGLGWVIKYHGGITENFASISTPDYNHSTGLGLTEKDTNCEIIKDFNYGKVSFFGIILNNGVNLKQVNCENS